MELAANQAELKEEIKAALVEVLQERQDLLYDAIERAIQDIAFVRAIEEGDRTELVERDRVFDIPEDRA
ncbi:MAG TPA: hypothetical protein VNO24_21685 [Blastocatellia bacterium]|nr:hypothetical protein [Blastocatellia bacterium]